MELSLSITLARCYLAKSDCKGVVELLNVKEEVDSHVLKLLCPSQMFPPTHIFIGCNKLISDEYFGGTKTLTLV